MIRFDLMPEPLSINDEAFDIIDQNVKKEQVLIKRLFGCLGRII